MNAAPKTALASRFAMKARWIKVLAHALPRTWGQPCGVRKSALWSYDSRASGGSLYPLTAGARGKIRRETQKPSLGEVCRPGRAKWRWFLAASNKRKRCLSHDVSTIPGRGKRRADERNARGKLQNWIQAPSRKLHRTFSCWPELQDTETPHPELSAGDIRLLSGKIAECCPACYNVLVNGGCRLLSKGGALW